MLHGLSDSHPIDRITNSSKVNKTRRNCDVSRDHTFLNMKIWSALVNHVLVWIQLAAEIFLDISSKLIIYASFYLSLRLGTCHHSGYMVLHRYFPLVSRTFAEKLWKTADVFEAALIFSMSFIGLKFLNRTNLD